MSTAAVWPMTASQRRRTNVSRRTLRRGCSSCSTREGIGSLYRLPARAQWREPRGFNGAGKTTTIAMIMGLVIPTSGTAKVLGADLPKERYRVLHRMNFESPYVDMPSRLTVRQNLTVFAMQYGVEDTAARVAALAEELDLVELLDRPTGKLSA